MTDEAIPAATLVVVRDRPSGPPDLLMVERAQGMAFAGGALVFPGGRIDDADTVLAARLGLGPDGGARIAAIRETIEETAVPIGLEPLPAPHQALAMQRDLADGQDFAALLDRLGIVAAAAALTTFARWVPKFHSSRRFDTLFFIAAAPEGEWEANVIAGECTGAFWVSAAEAIDRDRAGMAKLIFPTRRNLERLAKHDSLAAILADAAAHPLDPITPWVEEMDGERFITIPDNLGYPVVRERLDGLWRG